MLPIFDINLSLQFNKWKSQAEAHIFYSRNNMNSRVQDFYTGQHVLLTGATGFLGKAILEKLLRSCPKVGTVYVLIRPQSDSVEERLEHLFQNSIFDKLKSINASILRKVHPISGDITRISLGLIDKDRALLVSNVSIVIHSAATVKFDENLPQSFDLNVNGLRRIVQLCKEIKSLKALVHISTAYANCDQSVIEEKIYPPPIGVDANKLIKFSCKNNNYDEPKLPTWSIESSRPNTYTFTKALAENILALERTDLPVCIVRPSIVTASWKEPIPGWIDNVNGATGIIIGIGMGALQTLLADTSKEINFVPVDVVVNLVLCAAWEISLKESDNLLNCSTPSSSVKVYNCCASSRNPLKINRLREMLHASLTKLSPFSKAIWYPNVSFQTNVFSHNLTVCFFRCLLIILDKLRRDDKSRQDFQITPLFHMPCLVSSLTKLVQKLKRAALSLAYFTCNEWHFGTNNMECLNKTLTYAEKQQFSFNMEDIEWQDYISSYCLGIRRYIMKDKDSTLSKARARVKMLYKYYTLAKFIGVMTVTAVVLNVFREF